jgi:cytochrome P450
VSAARQNVQRGLVKAQPWLLRHGDRVWAPLRRLRPVLKVGKAVVLTGHEDVRGVLERDDVFSVTYGAHMEEVTGPFILGWDDGPRYRAEVGALRAAVRPEDLGRLADLTRARAGRALAAGGPLDAVALADDVTGAGLDEYFGLPAVASLAKREDARAVFRAVFLDGDTPAVMAAGKRAAAGIVADVEDAMAAHRAGASPGEASPVCDASPGTALPSGETARHGASADTVLARLLAAGDLPDEAIPRNFLGLVAAWAASVPRAFALALDALLDLPAELARAREAAARGDDHAVGQLLLEGLRLQPQAPFLVRLAREPYVIAPGSAREHHVKPGDAVIGVTMSAMRDKLALDAPKALRDDRPDSDYLHFGAGIHSCFGEAISRTQFGVLGTALLREGDLRRAGPLRWGEAFPASLPLTR